MIQLLIMNASQTLLMTFFRNIYAAHVSKSDSEEEEFNISGFKLMMGKIAF